jgi:hypothetical protein
MDCSDSVDSSKSVDIVFHKAYNQNLILGGTAAINEIVRRGPSTETESQLHDLKLTFSCPDRWQMQGSKDVTQIPHVMVGGGNTDEQARNISLLDVEVDPETCEPRQTLEPLDLQQQKAGKQQETKDKDQKKQETKDLIEEWENQAKEPKTWWRMKLTLFSTMVSASFLAAYSVKTFYTGVVLIVGGSIRPLLLTLTH